MRELKLLPETEPKRFNLADWVVRLGVGFIFIMVGFDKYPDNPTSDWVKIFRQIGWGECFRYATGIIEAAGGIAVLIPRVALLGYGLLACTMAGAALFHLFVLGDPSVSFVPVVLCLVLVGLAFHRYDESH